MRRRQTLILLACASGLAGAGALWALLPPPGPGARGRERLAAPVEVAPFTRGPVVLRRTFSGALEARALLVIAPKVGGRVERLHVDMADPVQRGQVVAELDRDESQQAVAAADAEVAVAQANLGEAEAALLQAQRELERVQTLRQRGITSASELDTAQAEHQARKARLEVAGAQLTRARAAMQTARIRLGYTTITATWPGEDRERVVAERHVDAGDMVAANGPLFTIVQLDPVTAVFFVSERDYARIEVDQAVTITTDAHPGHSFSGRVERIAPVFRTGSRQARVEVRVDNADHRLKPGMFVRAEVVLARAEDAILVPEAALTRRDDHTGVFVVDESTHTVRWQRVDAGIREGGHVQLLTHGLTEPKSESLQGRVVTLGQQLIDDGSTVTIPDDDAAPAEVPTP